MFNLAGSYMVEMALLGVIVGTLKFKLIPFLERERERERERDFYQMIFLRNYLQIQVM